MAIPVTHSELGRSPAMTDAEIEERFTRINAVLQHLPLLVERSGALAIFADVVCRAIPMAQPNIKRHLEHEISQLKKQQPVSEGLVGACEDLLGVVDRAGRQEQREQQSRPASRDS
jgi:hypothetical protein